MGSPEDEIGRYDDEVQVVVNLTHDFVMQTTEVSQAQFHELMGYNPSGFFDCINCPVENVNWYQAAAYCNALSEEHGLVSCYYCEGNESETECELTSDSFFDGHYECEGFRLPTSAEFEYATRSSSVSATYNGNLEAIHHYCAGPNEVLDSIAWWCHNSHEMTHEVGRLTPSPWGLFDLLGNVYEWCSDWRESRLGMDELTDPYGPDFGTSRVLRGGSYVSFDMELRSAAWTAEDPEVQGTDIGFRPVRTVGLDR